MYLETLKTGACHRFLCVGVKGMLLAFCLRALPAPAQIALPDEPEPEREERTVEAAPEEIQSTEKELNQLIEKLRRSDNELLIFGEETTTGSAALRMLQKQKALFESAPKKLKVSCELFSGETFWGEMENRSFVIRNPAGAFPVLMHQLELIQTTEEKGTFIFRFSQGDLLEGVPGLDVFNVRLPDGGQRLLRISELKSAKLAGEQP